MDNEYQIAALIHQRRRQILVHSYIYYELDDNIISDQKWSQWAMELAELQKKYPEVSEKVLFAETFANFDGSTGADLDYKMPWIPRKANQLLRCEKDIEA